MKFYSVTVTPPLREGFAAVDTAARTSPEVPGLTVGLPPPLLSFLMDLNVEFDIPFRDESSRRDVALLRAIKRS